ncbi:PilW family protein [Granulosicoccaceae sp. 1_MG-2023]|nr:PilW family protein [Granulosicoccaceae sp. 1_MG-2023]
MSIKRHANRGFSLVELMIAMGIGVMLFSGILTIFTSSRQSFDLTNEISAVQENARFALERLANDIRMAGFQGCATSTDSAAAVQASNAPTTNPAQTAVRGAEVTSAGWLPSQPAELAGISPEPRVGSDVLMLQLAEPVTERLATAMLTPSDNLELESNSIGLAAGDLAVVADCQSADLFRVTAVSGTTIEHGAGSNFSGNLQKAYSPGATTATDPTRVMKYSYRVYYVADTGRTNTSGDPVYSLYVYDMEDIDNDDPAEELIEGVEFLQLQFGAETGLNVTSYFSADGANYDPDEITLVRLGMLMHTIEESADEEDTRTYSVLDEDIGPQGSSGTGHGNDKRARMVFTSSVKIRNRRL